MGFYFINYKPSSLGSPHLWKPPCRTFPCLEKVFVSTRERNCHHIQPFIMGVDDSDPYCLVYPMPGDGKGNRHIQNDDSKPWVGGYRGIILSSKCFSPSSHVAGSNRASWICLLKNIWYTCFGMSENGTIYPPNGSKWLFQG